MLCFDLESGTREPEKCHGGIYLEQKVNKMSSELIDRTASNSDTIDRTKSKLREDRSADMDVTESTCVPGESNESNDGGSKDDNVSAENSPKYEGVINGTDVEETGSTGKPTVSNLSTADEATVVASAICPVDNLDKLNETHNGKYYRTCFRP